jgi:uncharacterized protein (TIGR03435 family)
MMVRSLLAERCKLALHEETRQVSVAALVVVKSGKLGPQLQPHPAVHRHAHRDRTHRRPASGQLRRWADDH